MEVVLPIPAGRIQELVADSQQISQSRGFTAFGSEMTVGIRLILSDAISLS